MSHLDDVFRYAMSRLNNREEAEDVAIEVVQSLPASSYRRDLRAYMIGMARRKIADRFRRAKRSGPIRDAEQSVRFESQVEQAVIVAEAMKRIPDDQREVLVLKYVSGLSSAEIGQLLRKRPDAVDSQLQRARDAFARVWSELTAEETHP